MKFIEKNLINSYFNERERTCDLEFRDGIEHAWIRNAPFMKYVTLSSNYWTDKAIRYALKNGGIVEEEEVTTLILYKVTTTFWGADGSSEFYFDTKKKAKAYLQEQDNGAITKVKVRGDVEYNCDGGTWSDLLRGWGSNLEIEELE